MPQLARMLTAVGAAGVALGVALPWATVEGLTFDLDVLGVEGAVARVTVNGLDTDLWPAAFGLAAVVALFSLVRSPGRFVRVVQYTLGALVVFASAALVYYVSNLVELELRDRSSVERAAADALIDSTPGSGPYVMGASGLVIVVAAHLRGRPRTAVAV